MGLRTSRKKHLFQPHLQIKFQCSPGFLTVENTEAISLCLHLGGTELCGHPLVSTRMTHLGASAVSLLAQEQDMQQHGIQNAGPSMPALCFCSSLPRGCDSRHTMVWGHLWPGESLTTFSFCSFLPYWTKYSISGPEEAFRAA